MSAALMVFVSPSAKFHFLTYFVTSLFILIIHPHYMEVDEPSRQKPGLRRYTAERLLVLPRFADVLKVAMIRLVPLD